MAKHILYAEDDDNIRRAVLRHLAPQGIEVTEVSALHHFMIQLRSGKHFDLILTDNQLEDGSVLEFIKAIHKAADGTPILMVSGSIDQANIDSLKRMGIYAMPKSNVEECFALINQLLNK